MFTFVTRYDITTDKWITGYWVGTTFYVVGRVANT